MNYKNVLDYEGFGCLVEIEKRNTNGGKTLYVEKSLPHDSLHILNEYTNEEFFKLNNSNLSLFSPNPSEASMSYVFLWSEKKNSIVQAALAWVYPSCLTWLAAKVEILEACEVCHSTSILVTHKGGETTISRIHHLKEVKNPIFDKLQDSYPPIANIDTKSLINMFGTQFLPVQLAGCLVSEEESWLLWKDGQGNLVSWCASYNPAEDAQLKHYLNLEDQTIYSSYSGKLEATIPHNESLIKRAIHVFQKGQLTLAAQRF